MLFRSAVECATADSAWVSMVVMCILLPATARQGPSGRKEGLGVRNRHYLPWSRGSEILVGKARSPSVAHQNVDGDGPEQQGDVGDRVAEHAHRTGRRGVPAKVDDASQEPDLVAAVGRLDLQLRQLDLRSLFTGEHDEADCIVQVNAKDGGVDAQDWTEILLRMYTRWAERRGFTVEVDEVSEGTEAGLLSAEFTIDRKSTRLNSSH